MGGLYPTPPINAPFDVAAMLYIGLKFENMW